MEGGGLSLLGSRWSSVEGSGLPLLGCEWCFGFTFLHLLFPFAVGGHSFEF